MSRAIARRLRCVVVLMLCAVSVAYGTLARADVRLPATITDNMVLQRDMAAPIWGWADPGEQVTVALGTERASVRTGADGKWRVELGPLSAGGPHVLKVAGANSLEVSNVLVGEVWLCSGQSNMWWPVRYAANAQQEAANGDYPNIRFFTTERKEVGEPLEDVKGRWVVCSPRTAPHFSAAGYYFGRALHKELGVPIGLIHSSCGATAAEVWTGMETLKADPAFKSILDRWEANPVTDDEQQEQYRRDIAAWEKASAEAEASGQPAPPKPHHVFPERPSGLYNSMIRPLVPFAIRGAIWYQGEANVGRPQQYQKLFPAMIGNWRQIWGQSGMPFLYVQLANYHAVQPEPTESKWAELREAQLKTLALPGAGMAVIIDIGEADNIHPANKQEVGRRLALIALAKCYGRDLVYSGPIYDGMAVEGREVRLTFKHVGGGLATSDGEAPKGFAIATADGPFVWARARIDGNDVVVWSDDVPNPAAVRYAWADNPVCNLCNKEGLPASPFRTSR